MVLRQICDDFFKGASVDGVKLTSVYNDLYGYTFHAA